MSERGKVNRTKREARQKKQAQNAIKWLPIALFVCVIIWIIVAVNVQRTSRFETKRRFLVKKGGAFKRAAFSSSHIQQGYIPYSNTTMGIRVRDNEACSTIKGKSTHSGMARYEPETKTTLGEASHLLQFCQGDIADKRRYLVKSGDHVSEVDEFYGDSEGLAMVEVELKSESEPHKRPDFIGPEVTGDARFYNEYTLTDPFSTWKDTLPEEYR